MKHTLTLLALILAGCMSSGVAPAPPVTQTFFQQTELESGAVKINPVLFHGIPLNYGVRVSGAGTVTFQYPAKPHAIFDGEIVVEPLPYVVAQIKQAIADGRMLVLRGGKPAALVAPGTITKE